MSISLDDFLKYLLKKWMPIVICMLCGSIMAILAARHVGNSIVVPPNEKYAELKEQETYFLDYINNSVTMQINPLNVFERTIFIDNIVDRNALKDYVDSGKIWENSDQVLAINYLIELVIWEDRETTESVELKVQHSEENICGELAVYLAQQIQLFDKDSCVTVGEQRTLIDKSISDKQEWYRNRLQDIQGQLEYTAEGCTIEVSGAAAVVFGALMGGVSAITLLFLLFLLKKDV